MMISATEQDTVLLIENDGDHADLIIDFLRDAGFSVVHLRTLDEYKLIDYKVRHPDSQLVIMDLELVDGGPHTEGQGIIERKLWPVDRNALFIVFSQYVDDLPMPKPDKLRPHWIWIHKEVRGGTISDVSLRALLGALEGCKEALLPPLRSGRVESEAFEDLLRWFVKNSLVKVPDNTEKDLKAILRRSAWVQRDLLSFADRFPRVGDHARGLGFILYGSGGRWELSRRTDLEISGVVASKGGQDSVEEDLERITLHLWNRLAHYVGTSTWPEDWKFSFQGKKLFEDQIPPVLPLSELEWEIKDGYCPILSVHKLMALDPKRSATGNRVFQLLTEVCPVFNPELIDQVRWGLLNKIAENPSDPSVLIEAPKFKGMVDTFFQTFAVYDVEDMEDLKNLCFRLLNVVALRLTLARLVMFDSPSFSTQEGRGEFLRAISEPGVVKVMRLLWTLRDRSFSEETLRIGDQAVVSYLNLLTGFVNAHLEGDQAEKARSYRSSARRVLSEFSEFFKELRLSFGSQMGWLLNQADLAKLDIS